MWASTRRSRDQVLDALEDQKGADNHQHNERGGARVPEQPCLPRFQSLRGAVWRHEGDDDRRCYRENRGQGEDGDRDACIEATDVRLEDLACRRQREPVAEYDRSDREREQPVRTLDLAEPLGRRWLSLRAFAAAVGDYRPDQEQGAEQDLQ